MYALKMENKLNKKAVGYEPFIKFILWAIFFAIAIIGVYFLYKKIGV